MFGSICSRFFLDSNGLLNKHKIASAIQPSTGSNDFVIVSKTNIDAESHNLLSNVDNDLQILNGISHSSNFDEFWLCFATNRRMCIDIVNVMMERHQFWCFQSKPLIKAVAIGINDTSMSKDICRCIVTFVLPEPPIIHFDSDIFLKSEYKNVIVSDQHGGLISCNKCTDQKSNPIFSIKTCLQIHIDNHLKSAMHCDA